MKILIRREVGRILLPAQKFRSFCTSGCKDEMNTPEHLKTRKNFSMTAHRREFMDKLYFETGFLYLDDWLYVTPTYLIKNGGKSLLCSYYSNNIQKLLQSIYPNFPWDFTIILDQQKHLNLIENQKKIFDKVYIALQLRSMKSWEKIPKTFISSCPTYLQRFVKAVLALYSNDLKKALQEIYPEETWNFRTCAGVMSMKEHRRITEQTFINLGLKDMEEFVFVSPSVFTRQAGKNLLQNYYSYDMKRLLRIIYGNYPWNFDVIDDMQKFLKGSIQNQKKIMEYIIYHLRLKTIKELGKFNTLQLLQNCPNHLVKPFRFILDFYEGDLKKTLVILYPEISWKIKGKTFI
jgi:hypothetical protein